MISEKEVYKKPLGIFREITEYGLSENPAINSRNLQIFRPSKGCKWVKFLKCTGMEYWRPKHFQRPEQLTGVHKRSAFGRIFTFHFLSNLRMGPIS
jgi:hypothetical protein